MLEEDSICIQQCPSPEHIQIFRFTSLRGLPLGRAVEVTTRGEVWWRHLLRRFGLPMLPKHIELHEALDDSLLAVMQRHHQRDGMSIRVYDSQSHVLGWFGITRRRASQLTIHDRDEAAFAHVSSAQIPCTFHAPSDARLLASVSRESQRVLVDMSQALAERPLDKLLILAAALWIMLTTESGYLQGSS